MSGYFEFHVSGKVIYHREGGGSLGLGEMLFDYVTADFPDLADGWKALMTFLHERHVYFAQTHYTPEGRGPWAVGRGYWRGDQRDGEQVTLWDTTGHPSLGHAIRYALERLNKEAA